MKYTIISIDDSRQRFKDKIRKEMAGVEEISVECLDARPLSVDLDAELAKRGLHFAPYWINQKWKRGDIGGFIGHFNSWEAVSQMDEDLLVFEDDAAVPDGFLNNVESLVSEVPAGYGIISLCVNEYNQHFYNNHVEYDMWGYHAVNKGRQPGEANQFDYGAPRMARAYQSWTMTATLYSPTGGKSLVKSARELGVHMNADAYIYHRAHCGDFEAYAPKPEYLNLVAEFYNGWSMIQSAEH